MRRFILTPQKHKPSTRLRFPHLRCTNMSKSILPILLLFIGVLIYALFRPDVIFLKPLWNILSKNPHPIINNIDDTIFGKLLIYSFPDALWYAALLIIQKKVLRNSLLSKIIYGFSIALPFILEILQGLHLINGTFDWIDILCYLATLILVLLIPSIYHNASSWMNIVQLALFSFFVVTALACDHNLVRKNEAHRHHSPPSPLNPVHHKSCPYYHISSYDAHKPCPICHGNKRYNPSRR